MPNKCSETHLSVIIRPSLCLACQSVAFSNNKNGRESENVGTKVIYQRVLSSGWLRLDLWLLDNKFFLYFNFKQTPLFTNNVRHIWFPLKSLVWNRGDSLVSI